MKSATLLIFPLIFSIPFIGCDEPGHDHPPRSYTTVWDIREDLNGNISLAATNRRSFNISNSLDDSPVPEIPHGVVLTLRGNGELKTDREFIDNDAYCLANYYLDNKMLLFSGSINGYEYPQGLWVKQYDSTGWLEWHRDVIFEFTGYRTIYDSQIFNGGVVACGEDENNTTFVFAVDNEANLLFYQEFLGVASYTSQIVSSSNGGFCLLSNAGSDHLLFLNSTGQLGLDLERGIDEPYHWNTIAATPYGTVMVAGNMTADSNFGLQEYDLSGLLIRNIEYPMQNWELNQIYVDSDSTILLAATPDPSESGEIYLLKLSASGDFLWETTLDIGGENHVQVIRAHNQEGYLIAGESQIDPYFRNPFVISIHDNGFVRWSTVRQIG